eukprot:m.9160 g.9160  ORF g.9160 m.9160 type:complete len:70 (-) comp7471_c0_seq1:125-334(-)
MSTKYHRSTTSSSTNTSTSTPPTTPTSASTSFTLAPPIMALGSFIITTDNNNDVILNDIISVKIIGTFL